MNFIRKNRWIWALIAAIVILGLIASPFLLLLSR